LPRSAQSDMHFQDCHLVTAKDAERGSAKCQALAVWIRKVEHIFLFASPKPARLFNMTTSVLFLHGLG
jgi:hypothetical protein